ncbi:hypothetical protein [Thermofilum pendens]|uniref:Uncharacterized protein n=1 Tax=Thermofilum pendens (strain DSM 2475 / Hrk 5) TaxID=368408 RepID=A1S0F5_THEPD|nr:hypothetical protein [Thermofilum pendens]ABL78935.1 conserved hypothetical protein [Thermofilum pendens Hrk 5]
MDLKCFDKITVGPVKVKGRRTSVRYVLEFDGLRKEYELVNVYPEDLDPRVLEEASSMAGIVPAVNYALFADEIRLDVKLHSLDLRFFEDMARVTAGDIFVNRIVARTGLIKEEYLPDPESVTPEDAEPRATVVAENVDDSTYLEAEPDYSKCGVMSSGGKESLFAYGLLREAGCEVYPFFLNEAGRHWWTALTAYRELSRRDPNTRRVWSNVDRLFAFIEKNMKIVVPNYWRKNREIYPVRLFWYAHYILSFLPLALKYGVGNIVMGNEFDDPSGLTFEYKGIRHYYATYDQSLDFDVYMTRYFEERGLGIKQWSPLRPVTPITILRILFDRYPDLAPLVTSCHSTHVENGVVKPCGTCYKCNGVLLMLLAVGADPRLLRYDERHVETLPERLSKGLVRLEPSLVKHSLYLVASRGLWRLPGAEPVWHVEMIHFDGINSTPDFIPHRDLRLRVLSIYEKYTRGYAKLENGQWVQVDPESIPGLR